VATCRPISARSSPVPRIQALVKAFFFAFLAGY
jgi:hypothetical protein